MTKKLLVRLPNWVGDVIMALPAIDCLAQNNIEPILLGKPWIHDLLKGLPFTKYSYPQKWSDSIKLLQSLSIEDILLFPNSFSSALIAKLARKKTFGFISDHRGLLLNQGWEKPNIHHESQLFFSLSQQYLGLKSTFHPPFLNIDEQSFQDAAIHQISTPYVVLCPFAHGLTKNKQSKKWPYWQQLIDKLDSITCIICPGPQELEEAQANFSNAQILPKIKLNEYAALLANAKLVIANDSGPMHIAAAVNAPTISIFGRTDPQRVAPQNAIVIGNHHTWPSLEEALKLIINRL